MNSDDDHLTPDSDGFTSSEKFDALESQMMVKGGESAKPGRKLTENADRIRLQTAEMDHLPRTPLKDKYEFLSVLGAGGAGVIYKAKQQPLGRLVAVKMIHSHLMAPTAVRRFQQEATTIAKISHPNIISVYDFGISEENQPFMVMDYAEGTPLSELLDQEGQLSVESTLSIAKQLCDGLAHAHYKGILHRDLKPSNIMMVKSEHGPDIAKILDFGLAKIIFDEEADEPEHLTKTGETVGTPAFMSPEQVMGKGLDQKSDIYALGCVMYHCLTGEPPFVGETKMETMLMHLNSTPEPINPSGGPPVISPYLEMVILKSLEKLPEDRFESMMEMKTAIEATEKGLFVTPSSNNSPTANQVASKKTNELPKPSSALPANTSGEAANKQIVSTRTLLVVLIAVGAIGCSLVGSYVWINAYPSEETKTVKKTKPKKGEVFDEDAWYDDAFKGRIDPKSHHISAHHDPEISDKGLAALKNNQSVRTIDMSEAHKITEKGIRYLKGNFIQVLNLHKTQVHDGVAEYLTTMEGPDGSPSLVDLNLGETPVTDAIIPTLTELPHLEAVDLSVNKNITNEGVKKLAKTGLKRLNLSKTLVDDEAMSAIASIDGLLYLDLSGTKITDAGVKKLLALSKLQELKLAETTVTDESIKQLGALKNLSVLNVARTQVTDKALPLMLKFNQLAYVNISGCMGITPKAGTDFTHEMAKEGRTAEKNETTEGE